MSPLRTFFLIGNSALLLVLAIVLLKTHFRRPSAILGSIVMLSAASMGMFAIALEWQWRWMEVPLNLLAAATPFAFWLLARSLFEDDFRLKFSYLWIYAVTVLAGMIGHYVTFGDFRGMAHWVLRSEIAHSGLGLVPLIAIIVASVALALFSSLRGWRFDLVESRRRARAVVLTSSGLLILAITGVEFIHLGQPRSEAVDTWVAGTFFVLILGICVRYLDFRQDRTADPSSYFFRSEKPKPEEGGGDTREQAVIRELERLMTEKKVYREEGITIPRLAELVGTREYQLRRLINGHLGYRNFNSFLNHYRVEDVARQLLRKETRHLPVLSIALDVGYRSLSPFNKAFRELKGVTPTEYRNLYELEDDGESVKLR